MKGIVADITKWVLSYGVDRTGVLFVRVCL